MIARATSVEPVKTTPSICGVGHEFRPEPPVAHQDMQRGSGDARLVHQRHGLGGDQRSLLGRFGDDGIAADQRRHESGR